jgi:hypothetical protein
MISIEILKILNALRTEAVVKDQIHDGRFATMSSGQSPDDPSFAWMSSKGLCPLDDAYFKLEKNIYLKKII